MGVSQILLDKATKNLPKMSKFIYIFFSMIAIITLVQAKNKYKNLAKDKDVKDIKEDINSIKQTLELFTTPQSIAIHNEIVGLGSIGAELEFTDGTSSDQKEIKNGESGNIGTGGKATKTVLAYVPVNSPFPDCTTPYPAGSTSCSVTKPNGKLK